MNYSLGRGIGLDIMDDEGRVVIDASVAIDLFAGRDKTRVEVAEKIFMCFKARDGHVRRFAPRLFLAEVSGVLARFLPPSRVRSIVQRLESEIITVGDDLYFRESIEIALKTGSRGAHSYYIGLARTLSAILVTSDRIQALNAKRAGVQAYYALEEVGDILKQLGCQQSL